MAAVSDNGRQRARRFADEASALNFEAELQPAAVRRRADPRGADRGVGEGCSGRARGRCSKVVDQGGVYAYETAAGTRWRFVYRQSGGSLTTRRGFTTAAPL